MTGAEVLVHTLVQNGVDVCFANPGTSEMHFVSALDRIDGMRCVLGLFEGVVTGAADGYYRMTQRPAATLLHLGPGLANGLANLHNAKKARSGIVNIVGDHATAHLGLNAPLTSDVEAVAAPMSNWVHTIPSVETVAGDCMEAVRRASGRPAEIATLILPADKAWSEGAAVPAAPRPAAAGVPSPDSSALAAAVDALRHRASSTLLLLGGRAVHADAADWAGRIAAATGCAVMSEFYVPRQQRGRGRFPVSRLPYSVDAATAALARFDHIILVEAADPVAFFAYPGKPGRLSAPGSRIIGLSGPEHDAQEVLRALAEGVGATRGAVPAPDGNIPAAGADQPLDASSIAAVLAACIPEQAIVVDEAISTGRNFDRATQGAAPHDWLTNMGGAIGYGLPVAVGAAIGAPGRKVIALEGDGSAMYTPQALWTMVRESLDVTVVVFANRSYQILHGELANVGAGAPGARAIDMLTLDRPVLDWVFLARGMGMAATRACSARELDRQLRAALASGGPSLIEVCL
ncbi:acetolactate synthase large subunit [Pigmentiphaga sp.]|uniref:acetolactate synthase large subunit n=1 Tax=Pigmentiphaga sp. TaxID=1977564 RepID=UPI0025FB8F76|nr:acetolactate synthase large subunit [Pigmentiphaga sp.]